MNETYYKLNLLKMTTIHYKKTCFLLLGLITLFLLFRNTGMYAVVLADEYYYNIYSRLLPLKDSTFPNYLYLWIYHATQYCEDGFLECGRILNILFFVLASPFIYLTSKRFCSEKIALFIVFLSLLSPVNSYTAYYMPESLYYFAFWGLTWYLFKVEPKSNLFLWGIAGVLLGLLSLIKPHALFLLPALLFYIFYVAQWRASVIFLLMSISTKLFIGYLLADTHGMTLFGATYNSIANDATRSYAHYLELIPLTLVSLKGHVLAVVLLFSLPLACTIQALVNQTPQRKLAVYTLAILCNLLIVVSLFSAAVANNGTYESITRLHMRYYNFIFPLFYMILGSQLLSDTTYPKKWLLAGLIGIIFISAVIDKFQAYSPHFVDSPELAAYLFKPIIFYSLAILSLIALFLWSYKAETGAKLFLFVIMPLFIIYSSIYMKQRLSHSLIPTVYDKAGIFVKNYLSDSERASLLIVGDNPSGIFRTMLYSNQPKASFEAIAKDATLDLTKIPQGIKWVLIIGDHLPLKLTAKPLVLNGYALIRIT